MSRFGRQAFTLIELLIVVAIIAILAAIAVPNFLEAQTRAKVTRTLADMRTVSYAMEAYRVDNNSLPARLPLTLPRVDWFHLAGDNSRHIGELLTTPLSYISSIPLDYFNTKMKPGGVDNKRLPASVVATIWPKGKGGLDTVYAPLLDIRYSDYAMQSAGPNLTWWNGADINQAFYDPTNGTVSKGMIVWFEGHGPAHMLGK